MNANVTLRSNVQVGSLADLRSGGAVVHAVRGRPGLVKLLQHLEPGRPEMEAARLHLAPEQIAELFQTRCAECGFATVGPVRTPDGPILEVRCPRGRCEASIIPTRELLVDSEMAPALRALSASDSDLSTVVTKTLVVEGADSRTTIGPIQARLAVRLPATLYYRFHCHSERSFAEHVKFGLLQLLQR
jgi:hypothetical protein